MKNILNAALEVAKSSALDGSINAADLRNNKKKVAFGLAKSVAWTLVQHHPLYIALKLAMWGAVGILALILALVVWWAF